MRKRFGFILVGLSLFESGCSLITDATCLTIFTVRETAADFRETARDRKWAESAWEEAQRANPHQTYSEDYATGFKDGFAHYLFRGGNGEPPPLPPAHYRNLHYQTPQGYKAIEDWFSGFRQGADAARQGGYRHWITGPSALVGPSPIAASPPSDHASSAPMLPPPDQASTAPMLPAAEPVRVRIDRPIALELPPAPTPTTPQPQRPNPAPTPTKLKPQLQRPSALPAASAPMTSPAPLMLPTIINGEATTGQVAPLPKIINGEPRSLPPPG